MPRQREENRRLKEAKKSPGIGFALSKPAHPHGLLKAKRGISGGAFAGGERRFGYDLSMTPRSHPGRRGATLALLECASAGSGQKCDRTITRIGHRAVPLASGRTRASEPYWSRVPMRIRFAEPGGPDASPREARKSAVLVAFSPGRPTRYRSALEPGWNYPKRLRWRGSIASN